MPGMLSAVQRRRRARGGVQARACRSTGWEECTAPRVTVVTTSRLRCEPFLMLRPRQRIRCLLRLLFLIAEGNQY